MDTADIKAYLKGQINYYKGQLEKIEALERVVERELARDFDREVFDDGIDIS